MAVAREVARQEEKRAGSTPAGMARWAERMLRPRVDWRALLGRAIRGAAGYSAGAVDYRYGRPSRRQGAVGYGIGSPILPRAVRPTPNVAIAIDTSGSMSEKELGAALSEVNGVLRQCGTNGVALVACDAAAGRVVRVGNAESASKLLVGGGGTRFAPAFDALANSSPRPDVIVYMTDGYGAAPIAPPSRIEVVWVLIGEKAVEPKFSAAPWGKMVFVNKLA